MRGCIIVPYRDRAEHLAKFVPHYRDVLPIIVVEQCNEKPFNRAKLLNVGFWERGEDYDYAVYSDVDMYARDMQPYRHYPECPTHLASACSQFNFTMPFADYFGGVTSISTKDMIAANGFSNSFWSWGAEDCEMREHLLSLGFSIARFENNLYDCADHKRPIDPINYPKNQALYKNGRHSWDGLTSCEYTLLSIEQKDGYTLIKVNI